MDEKRLLLIMNPRAGRSKSSDSLFDALVIFSQAGYRLRICRTVAPGDGARIAAAEGSGHDLVVAVGGDGTLNEVVSGLLTLPAPPVLGYLPQGSTNDFAASLHISEVPAIAAKAMMSGKKRQLDIGFWNARNFVYVASFGAFTKASYTAPQASKNALGHLAYILEGMRDLDTLHPYSVRLTADGENLDGDYLFGAVCNSTSVAGFFKLPAHTVVMDDGMFELLLIPNPRSGTDLQNLVMALLGQQYDAGGLIFRHISTLRMETTENIPWSLDGEFAPSRQTVEVTNHRKALTILL